MGNNSSVVMNDYWLVCHVLDTFSWFSQSVSTISVLHTCSDRLYCAVLGLICPFKHTVPMVTARPYTGSLVCLLDGALTCVGPLYVCVCGCVLWIRWPHSECSVHLGEVPFLTRVSTAQCKIICQFTKHCSAASEGGRVTGNALEFLALLFQSAEFHNPGGKSYATCCLTGCPKYNTTT